MIKFRLRSILLTAVVAAGMTLPLAAQSEIQATLRQIGVSDDGATDRIIVKLKDNYRSEFNRSMSSERAEALSRRANMNLRMLRPMSGNGHVLLLPQALRGEEVKAVVERLRADPSVEYAYADTRERLMAIPSDPFYVAQQYYLRVPNNAAGSATASAIDAPPAWDISTGSTNVVVGLIDGGVRLDHPDLAGQLLPGYDFISPDCSLGQGNCTAARQFTTANDGDGRDADASDPGDGATAAEIASNPYLTACDAGRDTVSSWHGTHVAGIIGARANNGIGIAGINWSVSLLPVRVTGKCGGYLSDIIDGTRWAAGIAVPGVPSNPTPAKVLNISLGSTGACSASAYAQAIADVIAKGVIVVAAAGNEDSVAIRPANCPGVISVGAVRGDGTRTIYSNSGPAITLMAPGGDYLFSAANDRIYSTNNAGTAGPVAYSASGYYTALAGTSFSSPMVAGVVALMAAVDPVLTPQEAKDVLTQSARPFVSVTGYQACTPGGSNNKANTIPCNCTAAACGAGYLDAGAALVRVQALVAPVATPAPAQTPTVSAASAPSSGGGGGGATDPLSLMILFAVALAVRQWRRACRS